MKANLILDGRDVYQIVSANAKHPEDRMQRVAKFTERSDAVLFAASELMLDTLREVADRLEDLAGDLNNKVDIDPSLRESIKMECRSAVKQCRGAILAATEH